MWPDAIKRIRMVDPQKHPNVIFEVFRDKVLSVVFFEKGNDWVMIPIPVGDRLGTALYHHLCLSEKEAIFGSVSTAELHEFLDIYTQVQML